MIKVPADWVPGENSLPGCRWKPPSSYGEERDQLSPVSSYKGTNHIHEGSQSPHNRMPLYWGFWL